MPSKVESKYKAKHEVESRFSRPIIKQEDKKLFKGLTILVPSGSDNNHRGKAIENAQKKISWKSFVTSEFKKKERMRKGQPLTINASEMEGIWPTSKEDDANRHKKFEPRERQYRKNAMDAVKENISTQLSEMSLKGPPMLKRLGGIEQLKSKGRKKHKKRRRKSKRKKSKRRKSKRRKSIKRRRKSRRK